MAFRKKVESGTDLMVAGLSLEETARLAQLGYVMREDGMTYKRGGATVYAMREELSRLVPHANISPVMVWGPSEGDLYR